MVKRCIGIDIGPSHLHAVQISRTGEQFCIEKIFSTQTRRTSDSQPDILRSLTGRYGFDRRADVAIVMPHEAVFFRNMETDSAGLQQIREQGLSALEHNFPMQPDEVVAQACSYRRLDDETFSVLTAASTRTALHERLSIAASAKMHPSLAEAAIFAIHSAVVVNHPEITTSRAIIAYIDRRRLTLAVTQDKDVLFVRNIPIISRSDETIDLVQEKAAEMIRREALITWQKVFGTEVERGTKIYLVTEGFSSDNIKSLVEESLHYQTTVVDPYARVQSPPGQTTDSQICVAEGLALRVLAPEKTKGINFVEADNADTRPALDLKKELVIFTSLVAAIAFFSLAGFFVRLWRMETDYKHIKNQITETFQTALPKENIVSPLAQLEQKLESFRKDYQLFASFRPTRLSPLEVLRRISADTPPRANMKVDDLLIAADAVRLNGACDSFESVYQWQRLLRQVPGFTSVDVQDVQKQPGDEGVHFTILLSSAEPVKAREHK